jgi:hypothetical protein
MDLHLPERRPAQGDRRKVPKSAQTADGGARSAGQGIPEVGSRSQTFINGNRRYARAAPSGGIPFDHKVLVGIVGG